MSPWVQSTAVSPASSPTSAQRSAAGRALGQLGPAPRPGGRGAGASGSTDCRQRTYGLVSTRSTAVRPA